MVGGVAFYVVSSNCGDCRRYSGRHLVGFWSPKRNSSGQSCTHTPHQHGLHRRHHIFHGLKKSTNVGCGQHCLWDWPPWGFPLIYTMSNSSVLRCATHGQTRTAVNIDAHVYHQRSAKTLIGIEPKTDIYQYCSIIFDSNFTDLYLDVHETSFP